MQIIGGKYKKKKLRSPKYEGVRPSSSRLRETLFNLCQTEIEGATFLDIFAGSGAVGLEALSRGARHVVFIERSRETAKLIKDNIAMLKEERGARVMIGEALDTLKQLGRQGETFDIIFADPPYGLGLGVEVAKSVDQSQLLKIGGKLYIEDEVAKTDPEPPLTHLSLYNHRKIGRALLKTYVYPA